MSRTAMRDLCVWTFLLLTCVLTLVTGQAPGDEAELCTVTLPSVGQNVFMDPPNLKPLMDTSHYEHFLPPNANPVWQRVDNDDNNPVGTTTTWTDQGPSCQSTVTACGYTEGSQDNWLITQFINRTVNGYRLPQVTVRIEYQQTDCQTNTGTDNNCQRIFDLFKYERSSVDPAAARNTNNYQLVESLTTQGTSGQITLNETENINFNSQDTGLYLAFRDPGTCILIARVVVYYHVCPAGSASLVVRPETIAPMIGSGAPMEVSANCIPNASPRSGGSAKLTCGERGIWFQPSISGCVCDEGFIESEDGQHCLSCDPGSYASVANNMCMMCPNNSNSTEQGLAECPCNEGFYRTQEEVDLPCTQPPSPPRNVVVVNFTNTVISLSWEEPEFTGGRSRDEIRYSLWYGIVGDSELTLAGTVMITAGEITDLTPGVQYQVFVSAENNISSKVPQALFENRAVSEIVTTIPEPAPTNTAVIIGAVIGVLAVIILLIILILLLLCCLLRQRKVAKKSFYQYQDQIELPTTGKRMYVDPTTYASPDEAIQEFASEISPKLLRMQEEIGAGEFGNVYKGLWKKDGKQINIAVKTLKPGSSHKMRTDFLTEASIMGQFDHPNVIKLYGVVTKVEPAMIVMEFVDNGSLYSYLRRNDERLTVERQVKMARCVAAGMDYLSTVGFVHRDLAARNVLVANDETCKVADFGLSRETVDDEYDVKKGGKIPVRWTAPEAIFRRKFTSSSDVWSFGVLLWEVMSYAQHPYEAFDWDNQTVLDRLEAGYRLDNPKDCPQTVYNLMLECWHAELTRRPPFSQIVQNLEQLLETNMQGNVPNNAPPKKATKTYLSSAAIVDPLEFTSVEEWLQAIKMERYKSNFEINGYKSINQILRLTEEDLRGMNITLAGHLYRITSSIEKAQTQVNRQPSVRV